MDRNQCFVIVINNGCPKMRILWVLWSVLVGAVVAQGDDENDCSGFATWRTCRTRFNRRNFGCYWDRRNRACQQNPSVLFFGNSFTVYRYYRPESNVAKLFNTIS